MSRTTTANPTATSDARREANRRNAQRSTGPKTSQGKAASRRNALTHGLSATLIDLDDLEAPGDGGSDSPPDAGDSLAWDAWVARQVARTMRQIDRAHRIEDRLRDQAAWRALSVWSDDRGLDAENLGATLSRDPARISASLGQTPHGCDWLARRWGWLARAAEAQPEGWNDDQTRLAFDLLGIAEAGRVGPVVEAARDDFAPGQPTPSPLELAQSMIAHLEDRRQRAAEADEIDQNLAGSDSIDLPTPELARLRRYESTLHRRLAHYLDGPPAPDHAPDPNEPNPEPEPRSTATEQNEPNAAPAPAAAAAETKPTATAEPVASRNEALELPRRRRPDLAQMTRRQAHRRRKHARSA